MPINFECQYVFNTIFVPCQVMFCPSKMLSCLSVSQIPISFQFLLVSLMLCCQLHWCYVAGRLPWCYVGAECASKMPSMVFEGATDMYYSHDTCFSTPSCREDHLDKNCPYDSRVSGWATSADCKHGWSDVCDCLYQGSNLPEVLYENVMDNLSGIALYGTSCAAWDHISGTRWHTIAYLVLTGRVTRIGVKCLGAM